LNKALAASSEPQNPAEEQNIGKEVPPARVLEEEARVVNATDWVGWSVNSDSADRERTENGCNGRLKAADAA